MNQKNRVINFTKDKNIVKDKIERGEFQEIVKGSIKREERKKPDYKKILKKDRNGEVKRHAMKIESEEEIKKRAYETLNIEEEERRKLMEENKKNGVDVNNLLKSIANNEKIMTPEQTMEWLTKVINGEVANVNGIQVGMEQRLKAANQLTNCWKDFKPEKPEDRVTAIKVTIEDLSDSERVETLAQEVGITKEQLDEIREEVK